MKNLFIAIIYFCFSCQSRLEIQPSTNNVFESNVLLPDFNLRIRVPSGTDVIRNNEFQLFLFILGNWSFMLLIRRIVFRFWPQIIMMVILSTKINYIDPMI